MATRDDVQQIRQDYEDAIADAETARAKALAKAADEMQQKDIIEATGYSRETVRRLIAEGRQILAEEKSA
jgi:CRP-like cAMP-binding protein